MKSVAYSWITMVRVGINPASWRHPLGNAVDLIIENVAEPFGEDERKDELLVFRRVLGAADGTGSVPDPRFERFTVLLELVHRSNQSFFACMRIMTLISSGYQPSAGLIYSLIIFFC